MTRAEIDFGAVFRHLPVGVALLSTDMVYLDMNPSYERMAGRPKAELIGHNIFDLFPDNPGDPDADGTRNLTASLRHVVETGERDTMGLQRYDVERTDRPGVYEERYWSIVNLPVYGPGRELLYVMHRVEEVTAFIRTRGLRSGDYRTPRDLEGELYMRARELQEVNEKLRQAHAREREVALTLQAAMLPALRPTGHHVAVRYQPSLGGLQVCGDWYDLVDLPGDRIAVAVGDVVGHGLPAAGVMGQLRSALSAACRVTDGPAAALEVVGLYARSVEGAECSTAVSAFLDWTARTITYSNAGHPPAALLHPDGTVDFLDQATDPPLGARPEHVARPQATVPFTPGSTLVLYTDGLVERRKEDIDIGLTRLARALDHHRHRAPEQLADALLQDLLPPTGAEDDTALVAIAL
ncbi:PP2C family protein-serine/threonine phosphatase [Actinacidiphila acidipaludis]|uniref:SpoIIE family protein phosphatase n=1 Tax=Actinacidiphila acidipaludis TaxID=2873382 RepID=A0ABS7Q4X2_9ACTN|nr:SpoIIE family protein phosphatase [Streptomyces acidipaludis]MBY8878201.1 SpoIIE family protein phosphatase [Streptomyces acidipaludis]